MLILSKFLKFTRGKAEGYVLLSYPAFNAAVLLEFKEG